MRRGQAWAVAVAAAWLALAGGAGGLEWSFEGGPGGEVHGTAAYERGVEGRAFAFDGRTAVEIADAPELNADDRLSVELWFKPRRWVMAAQSNPLAKWTDVNDANYVLYFFGAASSPGVNRRVAFHANAGGAWKRLSPLFEVPALVRWYHLVWTYAADDGGRLYVNGSLVGGVGGQGKLAVNRAALRLGRFGNGEGFAGLIDEVAIHQRVLGPEEVLGRYLRLAPPAGEKE